MQIKYSVQALTTIAKAGEVVMRDPQDVTAWKHGGWARLELEHKEAIALLDAKLAIWIQTPEQLEFAYKMYDQHSKENPGKTDFEVYQWVVSQIQRWVENPTPEEVAIAVAEGEELVRRWNETPSH